jgi:hypothetical protein
MTFGDGWCHQGRWGSDGLAVTTTADGAVIHRSDQAAPEVTPVPAMPGARGRTLHIGPGVALTEVGAFVRSLPPGMRPANYTVSPGTTRTPTG